MTSASKRLVQLSEMSNLDAFESDGGIKQVLDFLGLVRKQVTVSI